MHPTPVHPCFVSKQYISPVFYSPVSMRFAPYSSRLLLRLAEPRLRLSRVTTISSGSESMAYSFLSSVPADKNNDSEVDVGLASCLSAPADVGFELVDLILPKRKLATATTFFLGCRLQGGWIDWRT